MKGNALRSILKVRKIKMQDLAKRCGISNGYLSMIIAGERKNVSSEILFCLADELQLSTLELEHLLNIPHHAYETPSESVKLKFQEYLSDALDALDVNDQKKLDALTEKIRILDDPCVALKNHYLDWYEAWHLAFESRLDEALQKFHRAHQFKPRTNIERRFKAKILGGLGGVYTAQGNYKLAMKAMRDSLFLWPDGKQAGWIYLNMGTLHRRMGNPLAAMDAFHQAYELGASFIKLLALSSGLQISFDINDEEKARQYAVRGYLLAKSLEDPRGKCDLFCNIAQYYARKDKPKRAEPFYLKAIHFAGRSGDARIRQWALVELANLYAKYGLLNKLQTLLKGSEIEITSSADYLLIGKRLNMTAESYLNNGYSAKAFNLLEHNYKTLVSLRPSEELLSCCHLLIKCSSINKDPYKTEFYSTEIKRIRKNIQKQVAF